MKVKKMTNISGRLFSLDFVLILLLAIINNTNSQTLNSNLPVFAKSLGANNVIAGLVTSIFMITAIIIRPFWGYLSDYKGRKIVVMIGSVVVAITVFGYRFVYAIPLLLALRAFQGIGFSANTNTTATMAADVLPKDRLSEGIGYYGLATVAATAIGPPLGIYLINNFGFKTFFGVLGIISFASIIAAYFIRYEKKLPPKFADRSKPKFQLYEKSALPVSVILLFIALGAGALTSFIQIIAIDREIKNYSIYFIVYACSLLVTRLTTGRICDKFGPAKVLFPALACIACAFVTFAFAFNLPLLLLGGVFYGMGYGTVQPMLNVLMIRRCPPEKRGSGNSTFYISLDIGNAAGSSIGGVISQYFGFTVLYLFCELYIIIAATLLARFLHKNSQTSMMN